MNEGLVEMVDVGWVEKFKALVRREWSWIQSGSSDLVKRIASSYQRFASGKRA